MKLARILSALSLLTMVLVVARPAWACTCAPAPADQEAIAGADAVWRGTVVGKADPHGGDPVISSGRRVTYTFAVDKVEKGPIENTVEVHSAADEASCGYPFKVGRRYRVFAYGKPDRYSTNLCTNNERLQAKAALADGPGRIVGPPLNAPRDTGWYSTVGVPLAGLAALAAVTALMLRGRRKNRA